MSDKRQVTNLFSSTTVFTICVLTQCCISPTSEAREIDALLVQPFADSFKSLLSTITTGSPLEINFSGPDMAKNLISLSWQTGFPLTMPSNISEKSALFLDQLKDRINAAPIEDIPRRGIEGMRNDTNAIVDALVEEIRRSPDGIYTDLTKTLVNGNPLQDAMVSLGQQMKAFGGDLRYYQNIAKQVLGLPVLPDVASVFVGVTDRIPESLSVNRMGSNLMSVPSNLAGTVQTATAMSMSALNSLPGFSTMSNMMRVGG